VLDAGDEPTLVHVTPSIGQPGYCFIMALADGVLVRESEPAHPPRADVEVAQIAVDDGDRGRRVLEHHAQELFIRKERFVGRRAISLLRWMLDARNVGYLDLPRGNVARGTGRIISALRSGRQAAAAKILEQAGLEVGACLLSVLRRRCRPICPAHDGHLVLLPGSAGSL